MIKTYISHMSIAFDCFDDECPKRSLSMTRKGSQNVEPLIPKLGPKSVGELEVNLS